MSRTFARTVKCALLAACLVGAAPSAHSAAVTAADYARAERLLAWNQDEYLPNGNVRQHWIEGQDRFWYRRTDSRGASRFVVVDARTGSRRAAFDQVRIAAGLSSALGSAVSADALPFATFRFVERGGAIEFIANERVWTCRVDRAACVGREAAKPDNTVVLSPDEKWAAFLRDYNLWVRATDGSGEFALTTDGEQDNGYARTPGNNVLADGARRDGLVPVVLWSPDSSKILTHRVDEREVKELPVLEAAPGDGSLRPKLLRYRYAMANDEHKAALTQFVFDVHSRRRVQLEFPSMPVVLQAPIESFHAWWAPDSAQVYYVERGPYYRTLAFRVASVDTGKQRTLIEESGPTFIELAGIARRPMVRVLSSGEIVWFSERSGWGQLYLYDARKGGAAQTITSGEWVVRSIVAIDERERLIYFTASGREAGRNPYLRHLYRVHLDGSELQLLTPEDADHRVYTCDDLLLSGEAPDSLGCEQQRLGFAPSGRYFVDTYSRPDLPPRSVLRARDGRLLASLETADTAALDADGFRMPEPFTALAADGKTPLYGVILRPSRFDPGKRYPVIDSVYPGPQVTRVQYDFAATVFDPLGASALAELGFIVVTLDGRGTPLRSKAFLNDSYGNLASAGNLADHVAVLQQLARRVPAMDLQRVGVSGYSGGGFAALRAMLDYPQLFKVGVAASGNHDLRGYLAAWGETYNGPDDGTNYLAAANAPLAANLQGKLLLMHGGADGNVHSALTLQVVQALIDANKDFDLLIVPNAGHGLMGGAYPVRRQWDYFVRYLLGVEPPGEYRIAQPGE
jgi:dipeptidyl aminopeptidase/acylaminoacyl peptidase